MAPDHAAVEHPSSARWLNGLPTADPEVLIREAESERQAGRMLILTVADGADQRYLGALVLLVRELQVGELAYVIAPEARGRRLATHAVRLVTDWAFAALGLQRLQLRIDPENEASHTVAVRSGYQREGLLRSAFVVRGERRDVVMYSRLADDA